VSDQDVDDYLGDVSDPQKSTRSITTELAAELRDYVTAKGSIQFASDEALPPELVRQLVEARQREIQRTGR
jgi:uncharacterized protein YdhG (YjbR/CyaY superfamily)